MLVIVEPVEVTATVVQVVVPCVIRIVLSGTPKDCIVTLIVERTIVATVTLRDSVELTVVV